MTATDKLPNASTVSRALRRDAGIITQPAHKIGYSVHRGNNVVGPSIWVTVSDAEPTNVRYARALAEHLADERLDGQARRGRQHHLRQLRAHQSQQESLTTTNH